MSVASLRAVARRVLPRAVVGRASSMAAAAQRRSDTRKLATAVDAFEEAYRAYWRSGVVPPDAAERLFLATWASSGTGPRALVPQFAQPYSPATFSRFPDDLLRDLDPAEVARNVERHGCYVSPTRLPTAVVDDILAVLDAGPAQPRGDGLGQMPPGPPAPKAPTWWMQPADTLRSRAARRLLVERRLADTAGHYLGVDPMIMSVVLWKSFPWPGADKNSAQHFHYDNDRASFLKTFVYLTDVDEHNGAHVYVRGSHREKPRALLHGQRIADRDVRRHYPEASWEVVTGAAGTVFFADTQGFHKGGHVSQGHRAMFQINLASDRFGIQEEPVGAAGDAPEDLVPHVAEYPRYFAQLFRAADAVP